MTPTWSWSSIANTAIELVPPGAARTIDAADVLAPVEGVAPRPNPPDQDAVARVALHERHHGEPKAALLRHRHLTAYVLGTVEFGGADPGRAPRS